MRTCRVPLLTGFVFLLTAAVAQPCGGDYGSAEPVKLPGTITKSVLRGNQLHAIADGKLISVDLRHNKLRTIGKFDRSLAPVLDVLDGEACLASGNSVMLVDLTDGEIVRSKDLGNPVTDAGFLADQRVYVVSQSKLSILDLAKDKTIAAIDLGKTPEDTCRVAVTGEGENQRLIVPMASVKSVLAVIDPENGKVLDQVAMTGMPIGGNFSAGGALQVVGDKVFVVCSGAWTVKFGCVDLKERTFTLLKLPPQKLPDRHLTLGPGGRQFLTGPDGTHEYDAQGKLLGEVFGKDEGEMVGVWKGQALLVKDKELVRMALPPIAAKGE
jgi:hypothetical protein